jgi:hypothetical protein
MSDDLSFRDLLARLRAGDAQAGALIWQRFGRHMLRVANRQLRTLKLAKRIEPEDICQSVLREIMARPPKGEIHTAAEWFPYIQKLIVNKAGTKQRGLTTQRRNIMRERDGPIEDLELVDDEPDPAQLAFIGELRSVIRSNLRDDEWQIFELRAAGFEWPEIALQVGGQADALRIQHERRMKRIRRRLSVN